MYYHNMAGDGLGKFGLKKIKRAVKSVAKPALKAVTKIAMAPLTVPAKVATTAISAVAPVATELVKAGGAALTSVTGGLTQGLMPAPPVGPSFDPYQQGYNQPMYSQPGYDQQGGGSNDLFGGISPMILAAAVGVPVLFMLFMNKGKK